MPLEQHRVFLRVTGGGDEEQTAVDAGVLDEAIAHGSQLLAQEGRVLVLDVLDDGLPAVLVVDLVTISGSVDNVESQLDSVLNNSYWAITR